MVAVSLPPRRQTLAPESDGTIGGIIHVHTIRSDGRSSPDEIAEAAARAGLKFLVFTDHGDGTRPPDPPAYRHGVLCLDGVEISTDGGHYLALEMPASPYPLGGDPAGVVEDVKRLGGFGIVAHPNSPKTELRWQDWEAPFDAIEWLNPDTSWRLRIRETGWQARWRVAATLLGYPFRPPEAIAHLLAGTELQESEWSRIARRRHLVLLAGADAHARLDLTAGDPRTGGLSLPLPGYTSSFATLSLHVRPDRPLTGDALRDAVTLMTALRRGHVYTAVDGIASPPFFEFTAADGDGLAAAGDGLAGRGPVDLRVRSNAPASFATVISKDGQPFARVMGGGDVSRRAEGPGVYTVAIVGPPEWGSAPWIFSNPIYVGLRPSVVERPAGVLRASRPIFNGRERGAWRTESDPTSRAALDLAPTANDRSELCLRYALSAGAPRSQYAALAVDLPPEAGGFDRLRFSARSEQPLRILVHLHPSERTEGWQQSVYVDQVARDYTIRFDEARPIPPTSLPHPPGGAIRAILFVIDTTHARPGWSGRLWIASAALERWSE